MKQLKQHEIYENLSGFLQTRGIEFKDGSYAQAIQKSCSFLTDIINLGQRGLCKARTEVDKNLDRVRQTIHQATTPKSAAKATPKPPPLAKAAKSRSTARSSRKAAKKPAATARKTGKPGKTS